jgi:hypothetical protein
MGAGLGVVSCPGNRVWWLAVCSLLVAAGAWEVVATMPLTVARCLLAAS